ncbi:nuclear speckle splicing regulatory protein 1 [Diorhabda carinulata]|uniref:nuclear speckle splicing regulatory protein 1 n=1 Tax=Diorhabda carinulata TaxID=1163345 RepID=UPI0025A2C1C5|nr:nuclear speckle splicing regulatory protein 1 [Diorhabda carinulata]
MSKQYGLSFPKKDMGHQIGQVRPNKPSIFEDDSDNDDQIKVPTGVSKGLKKQDKISQEKAVEEDPTVYQYDEVYDEIEQKRNESKLAKRDLEKKPKYINRLLAAAEKRKRENERRIERQVQKEREEEGNKFQDKESFITPSYKKKLEEMRELEEQEKREEYLESIGDVKKQGNLDGFYRHLYDQKVNYEQNEDKEEKLSEKEKTVVQKNEEDEGSKTPPLDIKKEKSTDNNLESKQQTRKRKYRSRKDSEEDSNNEEAPEIKKEHLPSNIDADSDFSINSTDSEDEKETTEGKNKEEIFEKPQTPPQIEKTEVKQDKPEEKAVEMEKEIKVKPKKPKVDIWKKRTVGKKFDEAVKRYFERKALREMGQ